LEEAASSALLRIQHLARSQDFPAAEGIVQSALHDQIYISPEKRFQFVFHIYDIVKTPSMIRLEFNEDVNVAVRAKVITQDGTEEGKFSDLPFEAERLDFFPGNMNVRNGHNIFSRPA